MKKAFAMLLALAAVTLAVLSVTSEQSSSSLCVPLKWFTEYSTDGQHFQPLEEGQRFSARDGDLTLRMRLPEQWPYPMQMHLLLDHITATVAVNGETVYQTGLPDGSVDFSCCGRTWLRLDEADFSLGDELSVTLHNPHPAGANADAYNTFLDNVYIANENRLREQLDRESFPLRVLGAAEAVLALLVLSMGFTAGLMGVKTGGTLLPLALMIFCHGVLLAERNMLSAILRHAFVTSSEQMCMMFMAIAALLLCAGELGGRGGRAVRRAASALGGVTAVLLMAALLRLLLLYDAMAVFRAALLPCCCLALVCCLRTLTGRGRTPVMRAKAAALSAVMASLMLDAVNAWFGWLGDGVVSLVTVLVCGAACLPFVLTAMGRSLREAQRSATLEAELRDSRVTLAMSQIRTHFIFNVLNTISGMCKYDPEQADAAVVRFARYLRSNIDTMAEDSPVAFESELTRTEDYVALEQMRFGERIRLREEIGVRGFCLPPLILQPIVENAIRHGLLKRPEGGTVVLRTAQREGFVRIEVEDDGEGFDPAAIEKHKDGRRSVALDNVRFRLEHMVSGEMEIRSSPGKGTRVILRIPEKEAFR